MKISVVMPCHNAGPWIEDALRSVGNQAHPAHEVIVVDDGSSDDSVARVQSTGVATHILHVNHRNAAATRNAGIEQASGDWLAFLDADNWWLPDHLENAVRLVAGTDDVAYMAHRAIIDPDAQTETIPVPPVHQARTRLTGDDFVHWLSVHRYGFGTTGFILRRDVVEKVGGFDATQVRRHDWELFSRVVHGRTWSFEPRPTWVKRPPRAGDISSDDVRCKYFMLRGVLQMQRLYQDDRLEHFASTLARHAISAAMLSGDKEAVDQAVSLGWERLPRKDRFFLSAARRSRLIRQLLSQRRQLRSASRIGKRGVAT